MIDAQHVHGQTFQPIRQLSRYWVTVVATNLLEISKLRDFHPVAPDLPTQTPRAQSWAFPVVFNKANVVQTHVDANCGQRSEIEVLQIGWAGFDQHLKLIVVLQPVRVLTITPVSGTA